MWMYPNRPNRARLDVDVHVPERVEPDQAKYYSSLRHFYDITISYLSIKTYA